MSRAFYESINCQSKSRFFLNEGVFFLFPIVHLNLEKEWAKEMVKEFEENDRSDKLS